MRTAKLCCLLLIVTTAFAQQQTDKLIAEALKPSSLELNLRRLTDEVGGRVPGTPAMQRAVAWGVNAFKVAGADNVHTEDFTIQASWAEGATEMTVVAPVSFPVRLVSLSWAPALAPQHARVISVGHGTPEDFANAGDVIGAVVLVSTDEMHTWDDLFAEYLNAPGIIDRAVKGKALAIAFQSTRPHDLLYRHTNSFAGEIDRMPMVLVAREDAGRMERLLNSGQKKLFADLAIPNHVGGPIQATNVVAELRGSEKPDEFVILGAHLDSWELGTGALDNGCNAALVIDALRAIKASGMRPRRTMRFILFSGEEEGLLGSHAYVKAHRNELDKAAGVVIFDSGTGATTGFSLGGRKDVVAAATALVAPLQQFGATTLTTDAEWGTDHWDFMLEGVPTFVANQREANYLINYHAMSDTFDKVDMEQLKKHVADAAALSFGLADSAERVGPRLTHAQIEETMHETHMDDLMKTFGMWDQWEKGQLGRAE